MSFTIDYAGDAPRASGTGPVHHDDREPAAARRRFRIPSVVKTAALIIICGAAFFGAERYAPVEYRPSTLVGSYEGHVDAAIKAALNEQQARFDAWATEVRTVYANSLDQYRLASQGVLSYYQASYQRTQLYAQATTDLQKMFQGALYQLNMQTRGGDLAAINMAKIFGHIGNALKPGSGDDALRWAQRESQKLARELMAAASSGVTVNVDGWDAGLPAPDEVQKALGRIKALKLPPMPDFREGVPALQPAFK
jgi:hypothetical protein